MTMLRVFLMLLFLLAACLVTSASDAQTYNYTLLYTFTGGADGGAPAQRLTLDSAGNIYGSTDGGGGASGCGTIFKISGADKFSVLYTFTGGADGCDPTDLVRDGSGNMYSTASSGGGKGSCYPGGCGAIFKLTKKGVLTPLYSFTGGTDGATPYVGLVRDSAGNLYGTANYGGSYGYGTVFKLDRSDHLTVLYSFTGGADGGYPSGPMVRDAAGNLYGNTGFGGDLTCSVFGSSGGCGTVYKLDSDGKLTVLHAFTGGADGSVPSAVIRAGDNLYGTTGLGGDASCDQGAGCGIVFKIGNIGGAGKLSVLHTFTGGADGGEGCCPGGGALARDQSGNLYGATAFGGDLSCSGGDGYGCGTVFMLDSEKHFTVLYDFTGGPDGTPSWYGTDLVRDHAGNLYGVTYPYYGYLYGNYGTVFEVSP